MGPKTRAFLDANMTPERRALIDAWLATPLPAMPDPIDPSDCTQEHPEPAGPNIDLGQCAVCWMPVLRILP